MSFTKSYWAKPLNSALLGRYYSLTVVFCLCLCNFAIYVKGTLLTALAFFNSFLT